MLDEYIVELQDLFTELKLSIDDLDDMEVLCNCTNTCYTLKCWVSNQ